MLHVEVDADFLPVGSDQFDLLVDVLRAGDRREIEDQLDAVLRADAVGAAHPAGFIE